MEDAATPHPGGIDAKPTLEELLLGLSTKFITLTSGEMDREIENALRVVSEAVGIDLAILWQWSLVGPPVVAPTHFYCIDENLRPTEPLQQELFPWMIRQLLAGSVLVVNALEELPAEAELDRENCRRFGVKSNLTVPLSAGGQAVGAIGFNVMRELRRWPDLLVKRLHLFAEVIANALARKRADEVLQSSESRLAAGVELAGLGFFESHFDTGTMYIDERLRDLCGVPPDVVDLQIPEFWMAHIHPDDAPAVARLRKQTHDEGLQRVSFEYRYLHPIQGEKWLHHLAAVTARDAAGVAISMHGVIRDITGPKQAEQLLKRSYDEIAQLKDRLQAESDYLRSEIDIVNARLEITGNSPAIKKVMLQARQVASTGSTVLICGETGTGKELLAQAIHQLSPRSNHLMIKVNCAALPSGLVESELFGREKGAFTGALTRQVGRFEVADGSTLFLDEVGELPPDVQVKLLRVLQEGQFERLGSPKTISVNVRLIAATNRDLLEEVRKGRFREDLYYRLNVFPIRMPPLRERAEDIPQLVWTFLGDFSARMGKKITQVPRTTMASLQRQPWPGNVRQLRNVVEHGAIITTGETLRLPGPEEASAASPPPQTLADVEREHILRVLERTGWRIKGPNGAAEALGLNPATLYSRMKKLGVSLQRRGRAEGS